MSDDSKSAQERNFTTLQREITVAAREQGGDPDDNFRLRVAMRRAREANMPGDAIERARRQGTGELDAPGYEEKTFEGYGSDGIAVLVETISDDPRQTAAELEELFEAHGGNLGEDGCVAWQFERRGVVEVAADEVDDPDTFMLEVIEMGAEELGEPLNSDEVPRYRVLCDANEVGALDAALAQAGYPVHRAKVAYEPTQHVPVQPDAARRFLGFFEKLLEREDVQGAYANWTFA